MVKIRLQRHGKKRKPFYHIVVANSKSPRDGKFIEKLGTYNPILNPAKIILNVDRSILWLKNGAQPTNTARSILSHQGVFYKKYLIKGFIKKIITEEEIEKKFHSWLEIKKNKN